MFEAIKKMLGMGGGTPADNTGDVQTRVMEQPTEVTTETAPTEVMTEPTPDETAGAAGGMSMPEENVNEVEDVENKGCACGGDCGCNH